MFKEYNAHPKVIKTTDCVARAISTATKADYLEVRRELNRKKKELGFTIYKDTQFLYEYLKGYPRLIFKPVKGEPRIKGSDFTEIHPKGIYILKMAGHITAVLMESYLIHGIAVTVQFIQRGRLWVNKEKR